MYYEVSDDQEGRPSQERHTANSYSIWRTRNQDSRPYLDENKLANVRRDILRNNRLTDSEISAIKHATENDINIRHKGNEESDEQYSPPRGLIERLPSDQSTQRPEDTRNSIVPVKDSQENEKTTVTEDLAFSEEHRESMAEMRQKILNTLEVENICNRVISIIWFEAAYILLNELCMMRCCKLQFIPYRANEKNKLEKQNSTNSKV
ncbi:Hypothetical predicted protein [Octopus vulgaris]|uniref:Uncharacterized protein n=1 Tax=Octopus vulgaris TaxID=6645 RepID=A0AA36B0V0_OCTVU|nr:Hypothetical predicted protein [Octopus vulgaris]